MSMELWWNNDKVVFTTPGILSQCHFRSKITRGKSKDWNQPSGGTPRRRIRSKVNNSTLY